MKLGTSINLYAYYRGEKTPRPFVDQLRDTCRVGFRTLDIDFYEAAHHRMIEDDLNCDGWEAKIEAVGNEAAKLGAEFVQSHAPFNKNLFLYGKQPDAEYMEKYDMLMRRAIVASGKLGVKWMVVHPLTDTVHAEYDVAVDLATNLEYYKPYLELAKRHGVGLAIENMAKFDPAIRRVYCASPEEQADLIDAFGDPSVGACWDFGHARMMLSDQPRQLRMLGKRLKATHVQDNNGKRDSHLIPFVGGNIEWEKIMPCLKEIGYEGDFVLEAHHYIRQVPTALWESAGRLAYEFGTYCMDMYHNA
ncbi:MAG: sugar phosphate isomerase/epimerase [Clostridia bacterium]|nr:sugar phosphate isomerase/epimerase [Clostridia bacterium]